MISAFVEKDSTNIDDAITAVLIPQLAGLTKQQLGAIKALHSIYGVKTFFKDAHDGELGKKSGYVKLFENVLDFMEKGGGFDKDLKEKWDKDGLVTEFKSSEFKRWDVIDDAHTQFNKKVLSVNLPKFISQLEQLEDNSSM